MESYVTFEFVFVEMGKEVIGLFGVDVDVKGRGLRLEVGDFGEEGVE